VFSNYVVTHAEYDKDEKQTTDKRRSSNREIAQALFLSEGTVRNHITHILARLNLRDRTQAALVANSFLTWLENSGSSQSIE
jgi:FixJ family two-component response regulator